jgi:hypothetical protein
VVTEEESFSAGRSSDSAARPGLAFVREQIALGNRTLPSAPCGAHGKPEAGRDFQGARRARGESHGLQDFRTQISDLD